MIKHLVLVPEPEFSNIISGNCQYLVRFFKKRVDFINRLKKGDLIYLRKKSGEVAAQFNVGKLILIEKLDVGDWNFVKEIGSLNLQLTQEVFEEKIRENRILIIIQIQKLEQFITSPIDAPKSKKEWVVLED